MGDISVFLYDDVSDVVKREKGGRGESVFAIGKSQNRQEGMRLSAFWEANIKLKQGVKQEQGS